MIIILFFILPAAAEKPLDRIPSNFVDLLSLTHRWLKLPRDPELFFREKLSGGQNISHYNPMEHSFTNCRVTPTPIPMQICTHTDVYRDYVGLTPLDAISSSRKNYPGLKVPIITLWGKSCVQISSETIAYISNLLYAKYQVTCGDILSPKTFFTINVLPYLQQLGGGGSR